MEHWIEVAAVGDLDDRPIAAFDYEGTSLIIVRSEGQYYALENLCTHDYTPLEDGEIEDDEIVCAHHGARFCVSSGEVTAPPAYEDLQTFPTRVDSGKIFVCVDALDD